MKNPESKFSQWLVSKVFFTAHCQRIETSTSSGVPDLNVVWREYEFWVETKITVGGKTTLRPYQWAWINRRTRAGGTVLIISEDDDYVHVWDGKYISASLNSGGMMFIESPTLFTIRKNSAELVDKFAFLIEQKRKQLVVLSI
jgi:hypothetical protein